MPTRHLKCEVSKNKLLISPSKTFFVFHCIEPAFTNVLGQKSSAPSIAPPTSSHDQPCTDYCQQPLTQTPCFPPRPHYSPLNCQNDLFKAWTKSRHSLPLLPDGGITLHLDSYILVITYKALYKQALGYPLIQLPTHSALSPPDYALAQELPDWPLHLLFPCPDTSLPDIHGACFCPSFTESQDSHLFEYPFLRDTFSNHCFLKRQLDSSPKQYRTINCVLIGLFPICLSH